MAVQQAAEQLARIVLDNSTTDKVKVIANRRLRPREPLTDRFCHDVASSVTAGFGRALHQRPDADWVVVYAPALVCFIAVRREVVTRETSLAAIQRQ